MHNKALFLWQMADQHQVPAFNVSSSTAGLTTIAVPTETLILRSKLPAADSDKQIEKIQTQR
jgi:hypothetical protein